MLIAWHEAVRINGLIVVRNELVADRRCVDCGIGGLEPDSWNRLVVRRLVRWVGFGYFGFVGMFYDLVPTNLSANEFD